MVAGGTMCTWNSSTGCALKPPPSSITFSLMVTLVCYFFTVPLDQIIGYVQDEYAAKHPDFEDWGW